MLSMLCVMMSVTQQNVYTFWCRAVQTVLKGYHHQSCVARQDIQKWFSFGCFVPLGLPTILDQMHSEGVIISAKEQTEYDMQVLVRTKQRRSSVSRSHKPPTKIWSRLLGVFTSCGVGGETPHKPDQEGEVIFVDYLISNIKSFEKLLASLTHKDKIKVYSWSQMVTQNQSLEEPLSVREMTFIVDLYVKYALLHKIGERVSDGQRQPIYVALEPHQTADSPQVQREMGIFNLNNELQNLEQAMHVKRLLSDKLDVELRTRKKPEKEKKLLFTQMKMIEAQTENLQQRRMVLFNHLHTLENAITDDQMLETLSCSVNNILQNFPADQSQMRDALQSLNETKMSQQEMMEDMQAYTSADQTAIDEEYLKYQQSVLMNEAQQAYDCVPKQKIAPEEKPMKLQVPDVDQKKTQNIFNLDADFFSKQPKPKLEQQQQQQLEKQPEPDQKQKDKLFQQELLDLL